MHYKLVMNGSASGQDIKNVFYYRTGLGFDVEAFDFAGAEALAGNFKQTVWPKIRPFLCNQYTLETIDVTPINDEFELVYQMPYSLVVGEPGLDTNPSFGVASVGNFKFQLEPVSILNGIFPPKRGYVALGPVASGIVGEDGYFATATMNSTLVSELCDAISGNVAQLIPIPATWYPTRLKQSRILGGLVHWESFADVKGAVLSRRASWRRSRMPES